MNVYVAGASSEYERAREAMERVQAQGWRVAYDWVADVVRERVQGGKQDADLSPAERRKYAMRDLAAVQACDVFWLLSPSHGHYTTGAWLEFGAALQLRDSADVVGPLVVCSGVTAERYLFTSLADAVVITDALALPYLHGVLS